LIVAWWSWAGAIVFEHVSGAGSPPFKYCLPGVVATLALIMINLVSRDDLAEVSSTGDSGDNVSNFVFNWVILMIFNDCFNLSRQKINKKINVSFHFFFCRHEQEHGCCLVSCWQ
jgi:hypothetical protein